MTDATPDHVPHSPRDVANPPSNANGNGNDQYSALRRRDWHYSDLLRLDLVGNLVFLGACATLLLAALFFAMSSFRSGWEDQFASLSGRRVFEMILTIAGLGIFVSLVAQRPSGFVAALGIMVITALILPPREIMRFALLLTGSERRIDDFYESQTAAGSAVGELRSSEASSGFIIQSIRQRLLDSMRREGESLHGRSDLDRLREVFESNHTRISRTVENELVRLIVGGSHARLNSVGALPTLRSLNDQASRLDFIRRHEGSERFRFHAALLRYENAIDYLLDRYDTIELTAFGQQIVLHDPSVRGSGEEIGLRELLLPDGLRRADPVDWQQQPCNTWPFAEFPPVRADVLLPAETFRHSVEVVRGTPQYLRFSVPQETGAQGLEFVFRPTSDRQVLDPILTVASISTWPEDAAGWAVGCRNNGHNDDRRRQVDLAWIGSTPHVLSSHLHVSLEPGDHVLRLGSFAGSSGPGELLIRRAAVR